VKVVISALHSPGPRLNQIAVKLGVSADARGVEAVELLLTTLKVCGSLPKASLLRTEDRPGYESRCRRKSGGASSVINSIR
jgi:hypothetical protein